MSDAAIRAIIQDLDTARGVALDERRQDLIPFGREICAHLAWGMARLKRQEARVALLYTAVKFARVEPEAVTAAIAALDARGAQVRRIACALLAFSLERSALPALRARAVIERRNDIGADIATAISAIETGDHHRWVDRSGSGRSFWNVVGAVLPEDRGPE